MIREANSGESTTTGSSVNINVTVHKAPDQDSVAARAHWSERLRELEGKYCKEASGIMAVCAELSGAYRNAAFLIRKTYPDDEHMASAAAKWEARAKKWLIALNAVRESLSDGG